MKICPTCRKTYADASLKFCLDDGASLRELTEHDPNATWNLPQAPLPPTVAAPRSTSPPRSTLTARPEQFQPAQPQRTNSGEPSRQSALPWIFAIVVVLAVAGVLMAWLLTRSSDNNSAKTSDRGLFVATPTPVIDVDHPKPTPEATRPSIKATPTVQKPRPTPEPTKEKPKPMFAVLDNTSFNGSRITYYPRPSFGLCQADCAANANCKGFTWVRPGAYNPGDSAMCYLMSAVTARVPHNCCISGVRN